MPIPFETLLPYGIVVGMFCVSGVGLGTLRYYNNGAKPPRYALGPWDEQSKIVPPGGYDDLNRLTTNSCSNPRIHADLFSSRTIVMERDRRLTGYLRGQSDKVQAPPGFELNRPWKVEWTAWRPR